MQNRHREIIIAFTIAQFIVLWIFGYTPYPDSEGYIILAKECVASGEPYPISWKMNELPFIWNVGAINIVAFSLKFFHTITPVLWIYCIIKGATAWLTYQLSKKIFNEQIGYITLILYVVYPSNYGEATSLLSELPSLFVAMSGLWLIVCKEKKLLGGGIIALANWVRPIGIIFLLAACVYKWRAMLNTIAGYLLVVCLIGGATYMRTGHFIYQAQTGWMALLQYSVDHTTTTTDDYLPIVEKANVVEKNTIWRKRFFSWLYDHPIDYFTQMPRKLVDTYISDNVNMCAFLSNKKERAYLYDELSMRQLLRHFPNYTPTQTLTIVNLVYYYAILIMFVVGLFLMTRKKAVTALLLPMTIIVATTAMLLFLGHGEARFHQSLMPFFMMIAAVTIMKIYKHIYKSISKR